MTTVPSAESSSAAFSYIVHNAVEYPEWYKPFVGESEWYWYSALTGVILLPFIVITLIIVCCKYCDCCKKCCKCSSSQKDEPVAIHAKKNSNTADMHAKKVEALPTVVALNARQDSHTNLRASSESEIEVQNYSITNNDNKHDDLFADEPRF